MCVYTQTKQKPTHIVCRFSSFLRVKNHTLSELLPSSSISVKSDVFKSFSSLPFLRLSSPSTGTLIPAVRTAMRILVISICCLEISVAATCFCSFTNLFSSFISDLSESKNEDLHNLLDLIREQGRDYSSYTQESKKKLACAVAKVKLIKTVIDTPILTEEGTLTSESDKLSLEMPNQIQQIAN